MQTFVHVGREADILQYMLADSLTIVYQTGNSSATAVGDQVAPQMGDAVPVRFPVSLFDSFTDSLVNIET